MIQQTPEQTVVITITMDPTGNMQVNGPLANKVLFFGMLELAKDICRDYKEKKPNILVPIGPVPNGFRR